MFVYDIKTLTRFQLTDIVCIYFAKMKKHDGNYRDYPATFKLFSEYYGMKYKGFTNQKDVFDAYFDNGRKGWYQRPLRQQGPHFVESYNKYKDISFAEMKKDVDDIIQFIESEVKQGNTYIPVIADVDEKNKHRFHSYDNYLLEEMKYKIIGKHNREHSLNNRITDYKKVYDLKVSIGEAGEHIVESFEKDRLTNYERKDLADKVKIISNEQQHAGYDVESFTSKGKPLHIEVKSTSKKSIKIMDFYLTDNEYQKFETDPNHVIYYLSGIHSAYVSLFILTKTMLANIEPTPILYKVELDIEKKN